MSTNKSQSSINSETSSSAQPGTKNVTPLPKRQFAILLLCRFSDPVAFSLLFPFVYFMVRDFHISDDERVIGIYVGILTACFALSQCVSSVIWGTISDRFGRRPVILFGLAGTSLSMILFGLSPTFSWALVSRSLAGLLNGNQGVVKTIAAELTDDSNRAQGFTLLPLMFGLGSLVGPAIGGFLANPAVKYPTLFGNIQLFIDKPYFLPCGINSLLAAGLCVFAYFYLEETNNLPYSQVNISESSRLLGEPNTSNETNPDATMTPNENIPKKSWLVIIGFMLLNLQFVMQDELFPLWAATSVLQGGLGFDSSQIGTILSIGGLALFFYQLMVYSKIQRKFGTLRLFRYGFLSSSLVLPLFPLISSLESSPIFWPGLIISYCLLMGCRATLFTSSNILLAETCPNKKILGKVNGISQSLCSLMRGIGPILCGALFTFVLRLEESLPSFPVTLVAGIAWFIIMIIALFNSHIPSVIQTIP